MTSQWVMTLLDMPIVMFIVFGRNISQVISLHKNNSHDLEIVITHSPVLVILCHTIIDLMLILVIYMY